MLPTEYLRFNERQVFEAVTDSGSSSEAASEIFHSEAVDLLHPSPYHHSQPPQQQHLHHGGDRKRRPSSAADGESSSAAVKRPAAGLGLLSPPLFPHWSAFPGKLAVVPGCPSSTSGSSGCDSGSSGGGIKATTTSELQATNDDEWKNVQVVSLFVEFH
jgi:hypothetical protein